MQVGPAIRGLPLLTVGCTDLTSAVEMSWTCVSLHAGEVRALKASVLGRPGFLPNHPKFAHCAPEIK